MCRGLAGGCDDVTLTKLSRIANKYKVNHVVIESNFGDGTFIKLLQPGRTLITLWKTKTNTPRTVPLTTRAVEALEWSREEGHVRPFDSITYPRFKDYVVSVSHELGLRDVVVYTFRHTCASRLVQRGADIMRVKKWMGHSNIETTLGYAKLAPEDIYSLTDLL